MTKAITSEKALEDVIEEHLAPANGKGEYVRMAPTAFDREACVFPDAVMGFIETSQPKLWKYLNEKLGPSLRKDVIKSLARELDAKGTLQVLRDGFQVHGKTVKMAFWKPASDKNPDTVKEYAQNLCGITRQLRYSEKHDNEIDVVLSVNGLPIVSLELKNQFSGQDVSHAVKQYKTDRSPDDLFFGPKDPTKAPTRCLVNFAVDPMEAQFVTKLNGELTAFLPFNRGDNRGKGNPPAPAGKYRTHYLWEQVLARDSLLDLLQRFMHVQRTEIKAADKTLYKERLIFPRYHQLEAVRRLEEASREEGPGNNYLVQHSAGSGKSNTLSWLAYRLASLHKGDEKVFDGVVVITDRRILDTQIRNTIKQFEHTKGVVEAADKDSKQLAEALAGGAQIVVTTLQKFPFVAQHLTTKLPDRKYAIIIDEAHSSQTGEAAAKMKGVLKGKSLDEAAAIEAQFDNEMENQDLVAEAMARTKAKNISFYAFTATPKAKTIGMFGRPHGSKDAKAFHEYSMRQAIEEGFILDVLQNYTTYKAYYKLVKSLPTEVVVDKDEARKAVAQYATMHPVAIGQKVHVIIEHFRKHVMPKLGGQAKAMVVTASRKHAVRCKLAMDQYLKDHKYTDLKALVAFSGAVVNDGEHGDDEEYTEQGMNPDGVTETNLPKKFEEEYQVLIVAEKYQTGFDQPLLTAMYVDKVLSGVHAVQTLSRLNRIHPGKTWTFVLDFVNKPEDIQKAFQPYFEATLMDDVPDHGKLYELHASIMECNIVEKDDVDAFAKLFFGKKQGAQDSAKLYALTDSAVKAYKAAADDSIRDAFRSALKAYIHLYGYLTQLVDFHDNKLEKLYVYGRYLWKVLPKPPRTDEVLLNDEVALRYLRVEQKTEGAVTLTKGVPGVVPHPDDMGTKTPKRESVELNAVIEAFNAKFDTDWTEADKLFLDTFKEAGIQDPDLQESARANSFENFKLDMKKRVEQIVVDRHEQNGSFVEKYFGNETVKKAVDSYLARTIYEALRANEKNS